MRRKVQPAPRPAQKQAGQAFGVEQDIPEVENLEETYMVCCYSNRRSMVLEL
jgi:hypothetical protein